MKITFILLLTFHRQFNLLGFSVTREKYITLKNIPCLNRKLQQLSVLLVALAVALFFLQELRNKDI
jgi:hypothetical protein